eukprot:CAMPEP_0114998656 /NCGR_PEP_ID=MMETSP0216-20121206/15649_1 /TAXON_ID=223996 /ORGANISM="Protocruzia adherens, Strain Boccale" /LENGTH=260 /DNA_ID=CAMNT_0002363319 /DNA_START=142 /DNA_END=924 /DNA_ORIENTATION=+
MYPSITIKTGEYYRLFTCAYLHGNIGHIVSNMLALLVLGNSLEKFYGSMAFFVMTLDFTFFCGVVDFIVNVGLYYFTEGSPFIEYKVPGLGFSAVLFGYLQVYFGKVRKNQDIQLCGFKIKSGWFVVFYLILNTLTTPGASFFGHLSGIIVGFFFNRGFLAFSMPGYATMAAAEAGIWFWRLFASLRCYRMVTSNLRKSQCFNRGFLDAVKTCGKPIEEQSDERGLDVQLDAYPSSPSSSNIRLQNVDTSGFQGLAVNQA